LVSALSFGCASPSPKVSKTAPSATWTTSSISQAPVQFDQYVLSYDMHQIQLDVHPVIPPSLCYTSSVPLRFGSPPSLISQSEAGSPYPSLNIRHEDLIDTSPQP
jgi:hypothetical protein